MLGTTYISVMRKMVKNRNKIIERNDILLLNSVRFNDRIR